MMSRLLVLLAVISAVYATGNTCKTGNIVNRLVNNQSYYFPSTWDENQTAPNLEKQQTCSWTVTIPQGYYARLIIDGKVEGNNSRIQTVDSVGNREQTTQETKQPYFFPPPKFTLTVSNEAAATFAFKIQWLPLPTTSPSVYYSIGHQYHLINATNTLYYEGYSSRGGISLFNYPHDRKNYFSLRSTLVFDGPNLNGQYVGNLFSLYQTKNQYISFNDVIVLVNLEDSNVSDLLLIQSAEMTHDLNYVALPTIHNSTHNATLDLDEDTNCLISASYINQTMISVQMNDNDTVSVYLGTPSPYTLNRNYTGAELKAALPLFLPWWRCYPVVAVWRKCCVHVSSMSNTVKMIVMLSE